jgi:hypothetical protein
MVNSDGSWTNDEVKRFCAVQQKILGKKKVWTTCCHFLHQLDYRVVADALCRMEAAGGALGVQM